MMRLKKRVTAIISMQLITVMMVSAIMPISADAAGNDSGTVRWEDPSFEGNLPQTPSVHDDAYCYINYDYLKSTKIPDGYASWGSFDDIGSTVKNEMISTLKNPDKSKAQQKAAAVFKSIEDTETRNKAGIGTTVNTLFALANVNSIAELNELYKTDTDLLDFTGILNCYVCSDEKNSSLYSLHVNAPTLSLDDSAEYSKMTSLGKRKKEAYDIFAKALLMHNSFSEEKADEMIADSFRFEKMLSSSIATVQDQSQDDYVAKSYNPYSGQDLKALLSSFPVEECLKNCGLSDLSRVIVSEPEALKKMNELYNDKNISLIKSYLIIQLLKYMAPYADEFSSEANITCKNTINGVSGRRSKDDTAYYTENTLCGELLGSIYAKKYFTEKEKQDVTSMVGEIMQDYRIRLSGADWLSEQTRATAIGKLDAMKIRVGYPERYRIDWDNVDVSASKPFIENVITVMQEQRKMNLSLDGKKVDSGVWENMNANTVNAFYNASDNSINFPAAILNDPMYDASRSHSYNLGAIGNVIAHEITHAFDSSGSQFDKDGNMTDWWTESDRAAFDDRTDKVAKYYSSIEIMDGLCINGELTKGETVADLGSMACTLDIMRGMKDADYKEYFTAYANLWKEKITPEAQESYVMTNPHPPTYMRFNVTVMQYQEFYDTFGIKEGDKMYIAPEDRLKVW